MGLFSWFKPSLSSVVSWFKAIFGTPESKDFLIDLCAVITGLSQTKVEELWDTLETLCKQAYMNFPASGTGQQKYDWVIEQLKKIGDKTKPFIIDFIMHQVLGYLTKIGSKV